MPNEFETPGTALATLPAAAPLAPMPEGWMPMPLPVHSIIARSKALDEIIEKIFEDGVHYGLIPGTKGKRLHKPGVDAICGAFCFRPDFTPDPGNVQGSDFINITMRCDLVHIPSGRIVGTGIGNCNSREEKYRWKPGSGKPVCPECGVDAVWKSRQEPGYFCWRQKGGCGAKFPDDAPEIVSQKTERQANDNAWDQLNTILKMAQKRAAMAAVIPACGLSNRFSAGDEEAERAQEAQRGRQEPPPEDRGQRPPPPQEEPPGARQRATGGSATQGGNAAPPRLSEMERQNIKERCKPLSTDAGFKLMHDELDRAGAPWACQEAHDIVGEAWRAWKKAGNRQNAARY